MTAGAEAEGPLRLAAQVFKRGRAALQRELEPLGVHAGQHNLLLQLYAEEPLTVGQLAQRLRLEGPTVVRTVQRMESAGILRREPDPADRRRSRIALTERGRAIEGEVRAALARVDGRMTESLDPAERDRVLAALRAMRDNLDR